MIHLIAFLLFSSHSFANMVDSDSYIEGDFVCKNAKQKIIFNPEFSDFLYIDKPDSEWVNCKVSNLVHPRNKTHSFTGKSACKSENLDLSLNFETSYDSSTNEMTMLLSMSPREIEYSCYRVGYTEATN